MTHPSKFFIPLLAVFIFLLSACSTSPTSGEKPTEPIIEPTVVTPSDAHATGLDATDQALFEYLAQAYELFSNDSQSIWSENFRFDRVPLLLVRTDSAGEAQYGYLINYPNPESVTSAELVTLPEGITLPPVYHLDEIPNMDRLKNVSFFDYFYPINDSEVYMIFYAAEGTENLSFVPTSFQWVRLLTHEAFHKFQLESWATRQDGSQDTPNYPLDQENVALMMLEHKIILDALSAENDQILREKIQQFLAVRAERMGKWATVADLDNTQEQIEGTARYMEFRLDDITGEINNSPLESEISHIFNLSDRVREYLTFGRFYSTGAALCELMDRLGLDWKSQVEAGKTPYEILSSQIVVTDRAGTLEQAFSSYDFPTILDKASQTVILAEQEGSGTEMPGANGEVGRVIKIIQKPYGEAAPELLPSYVPEGFTLLGSFNYAVSELPIPELGTMYSPAESDVTVIDYQNNGQQLRISRAAYPGGTLDSWKAQCVIGMPGAKTITIAGVDVHTFEMTGANGIYSSVTFVYNDELISIEGPVVLDEMQEMIASIVN